MAKGKKRDALWGELGAAALGAAVGGMLGMLFAPKSGKQTRKELASKGRKAVAAASRSARAAEAVGVRALGQISAKAAKPASQSRPVRKAATKRRS